jgi:hypothetical protein
MHRSPSSTPPAAAAAAAASASAAATPAPSAPAALLGARALCPPPLRAPCPALLATAEADKLLLLGFLLDVTPARLAHLGEGEAVRC